MTRRVLLLSTIDLSATELARIVGDEEPSETVVVVPATKQSRLEWLTNDEDAARADAAGTADHLAAAAPGHAESVVGDADPSVALDDALRSFDATEIVLVRRSAHDAGWLEGRLRLTGTMLHDRPVTTVVLEET